MNKEYVFFTKNGKPYKGRITMERSQALIILNDAMVEAHKEAKRLDKSLGEMFSYTCFNGHVNAHAIDDVYKIEPITAYSNQNRKYGRQIKSK